MRHSCLLLFCLIGTVPGKLKIIAEERQELSDQIPFRFGDYLSKFQLNQFHRYEEILAFMKTLSVKYPSIASMVPVGSSFEGRQLIALKVGKAGVSKPSVWIDAGSSGRAWIGPSTAVFILNQLTRKYSTDTGIKNLVDSVDFYVLPVLNPDGYEYTLTSERTWMKTRSNWTCSFWQCCRGVHLDRNWDFHWNTTGTVPKPCDKFYPGPSAFSEPESRAVSLKLADLSANHNLKAHISLSAYGQQWLLPYNYAKNQYPPNYSKMFSVAQSGVRTLQKIHDSFYVASNAADYGLYSGTALDWVAGKSQVSLSYRVMLRPANGYVGYIVPSSQIIPTGEETFEGIRSVAASLSN